MCHEPTGPEHSPARTPALWSPAGTQVSTADSTISPATVGLHPGVAGRKRDGYRPSTSARLMVQPVVREKSPAAEFLVPVAARWICDVTALPLSLAREEVHGTMAGRESSMPAPVRASSMCNGERRHGGERHESEGDLACSPSRAGRRQGRCIRGVHGVLLADCGSRALKHRCRERSGLSCR